VAAQDSHRDVPRSRKGAARRARLIDAAKLVFERDGFLHAPIVDIAETAGLQHGSFYHYFASKEQIFHEVAEAQEERLTAPPKDLRHAATADESPREHIRKANRRYLERYRDEARIMGVIEQVSRYDEHVNAARMATQQHFAERAEKTIRQLQAEVLPIRSSTRGWLPTPLASGSPDSPSCRWSRGTARTASRHSSSSPCCGRMPWARWTSRAPA